MVTSWAAGKAPGEIWLGVAKTPESVASAGNVMVPMDWPFAVAAIFVAEKEAAAAAKEEKAAAKKEAAKPIAKKK